jgi:hypothetical protein
MNGIRITTDRVVTSANVIGRQVRIQLNDGTERHVDHTLLATGYQVDVSRCAFLGPDVLRSMRLVNGCPKLTEGFEASLPGLHFLGAPAAETFGPLMRFVAGTKYASKALTRSILRQGGSRATREVASFDWLSRTGFDA